jgi:SAM-dependent methyltransferase
MLEGVAREAMQRGVASDRSSTAQRAFAELDRAISPTEPLPAAIATMAELGLHALPVVEDGAVVGVLSRVQAERYLALAERLDFPLSRTVDEVSPNDGMFSGNLSVYLRTGASGLECVRDALATAGHEGDPRRILDFGCGHGRVLRFLKAAFPQAELTACDIDASAIRFCAEVLEAQPVLSNAKLSDVELDGQFDLIWSGSFFTHVDADAWRRALALLRPHLGESAVLAFSIAGALPAERLRTGTLDYGLDPESVRSVLELYERAGFGYADYPDTSGYGISLATPSWASDALDAHGLRVVSHVERAFDRHQDVVVAVPA